MATQFVNIYSFCSPISASCILYTAQTMSIGTEAPSGYYSDGTNCYTVSGPFGVVSSVDACDAPPPGYPFQVYNNSSTLTITEIRLGSGAVFWTQAAGTATIPPGIGPSEDLFGYGNTSSPVGVRVTGGVNGPWCQKLFRNGFLLQSVTFNGNNIHYFNAYPFLPTQEMKIVVQNGAC